MEDLFKKYLEKSEHLRPGYIQSLGVANGKWREKDFGGFVHLPELLSVIYSRVEGTPYEIKNQELMDFIPGYLLISSSEYKKNYDDFSNLVSTSFKGNLFPILRNYSSDFIAVELESGKVYQFFHDDDLYIIHENSTAFLETLNLYYDEKVFMLDEDGYLDFDIDKQYEVAAEHNPSIDFWKE